MKIRQRKLLKACLLFSPAWPGAREAEPAKGGGGIQEGLWRTDEAPLKDSRGNLQLRRHLVRPAVELLIATRGQNFPARPAGSEGLTLKTQHQPTRKANRFSRLTQQFSLARDLIPHWPASSESRSLWKALVVSPASRVFAEQCSPSLVAFHVLLQTPLEHVHDLLHHAADDFVCILKVFLNLPLHRSRLLRAFR